MSDDVFRLKASEIEYFLDTGESPVELDLLFNKVLDIFKNEGGKDFTLNKVVIENDLDVEVEDDE